MKVTKEEREEFLSAQEELKNIMLILVDEEKKCKEICLEIDQFYIADEGDMTYIDKHIETREELEECFKIYKQRIGEIIPPLAQLNKVDNFDEVFKNFHKNYQKINSLLLT